MRRIVKIIDHGPIKFVLLALVMLMPFTAWAQTNCGLFIGDYEGYYETTNPVGVKVTSANASNITHDCIKSGTVSFELETRTLTLENATIDGSIYSYGDLTINLVGDNYVTATDSSAIVGEISSAAQDLTIKGTGRMLAKGTTDLVTSGFNAPTFQDEQSLLLWAGYNANSIYTALYGTQLFSGGNGTSADNSYLIGSTTDLKNLSLYFEEGLLTTSCFYKLSNNINCSDLTGFKPIGTSDYPFVGTFNGKGDNDENYKISNLTYNAAGQSNYAGLFCVIGSGDNPGSVSNLILDNCTFQNGTGHNGAIAGLLSNGSIENCAVTSCHILSDAPWPSCGGIVGSIYGGSIKDCTVDGSEINATASTNSQAGGIVGFISGTATVSGCQVTGTTITGSISSQGDTGNNCIGGIVGVCDASNSEISIRNNKVLGETTISSTDNYGENTCAGAIVGNMDAASLSGNTYEYTVTTSTKNGEDDAVEKKDYEQRALGQPVIEDDETKYDIVDGAMLTGLHSLTLQGLGDNCAFEGDEGYAPLADYENRVFYFIPGKSTTIYLYPSDTFTPSVSLVYAETEGADPTEHAVTKDPEAESYVYSFEMPDAEATFNVTLTAKPSIWIGSVEVREDGTFPDYSTASFDAETSTLTLNDFGNGSDITSGLDELTIKVTGTTNVVGKIVSLNPAATLTFEKANADVAASLSLSTANLVDASAVISGFASVDFGNMYLSSSTPYQYDVTNKLLVNAIAEETEELTSATITSVPHYPLWITGIQATAGDIQGEEFQSGESSLYTITGSVTFTAGTTNVLALNDATITILPYDQSGHCQPAIISNLDNLTIQFSGDKNEINFQGAYSNFMVSSLNSSAELTFKALEENALLSANISSSDYIGAPGDGFSSIVYSDNLVYLAYGTSTQYIKNLAAPIISLSDGMLVISSLDYNENYTESLVIKYSVDYVDASLTDVTNVTYTAGTSPAISSPCTITAHAEYNGKIGIEATAKYFGFTEPMTITTYNGTAFELAIADLPAIVPAVTDGDDVTYTIGDVSESQAVTYNAKTNKCMVQGYGSAVMEMYLMQGDNTPYQVLNEVASLTVNVVPPAPTIAYSSTTTYLDTDEIEVTAAENMTIFYTWDTSVEVGNSYVNNPQHSDITLSICDEDNPIIAQGGTLRAWAGYSLGDDEYLMSEVATQAFTVKKDIANAYVDGLAESATYTGETIVPTFTLKESEDANAATISADNYDIVYEKYHGETQGYGVVESIVDAGIYMVSVKAKGDTYGGEKYIYEGFAVTQAENSWTTEPTANTLTYTGEAQALLTAGVAKFGDIKYKLGAEGTFTAAIPEGTNAGTYTVYYKVDGNENYNGIDASETNKVTVTISPATITDVTLDNTEFTYTGEVQTATISSVKAGEMVLNSEYYVVSGNTGTNKDTYELTVTAKENSNFTGSKTTTFTISAANIAEFYDISLTETSFVYNGAEHKPAVVFKKGDNVVELTANDYEVTYTNNVNVGSADAGTAAPTATITGKGNYSGTATANFTISRDLGMTFAENQTWASYYATEDLVIPEGLTAYIVSSADKSTGTVTTTQINYIPKNQAVLLNNPNGIIADSFIADPYPESAPGVTGNLLQGSENAINISTITTGTVYILYNNEFRRATSGTIPARRAYLVVSGSAHARLRVTSNGTTDINDSIIEDISDNWYNLDGRKFDGQPKKPGLYINNGKKVFIKK